MVAFDLFLRGLNWGIHGWGEEHFKNIFDVRILEGDRILSLGMVEGARLVVDWALLHDVPVEIGDADGDMLPLGLGY